MIHRIVINRLQSLVSPCEMAATIRVHKLETEGLVKEHFESNDSHLANFE